MVANTQGQSAMIHERYGTSACFVDVNSAVDLGDKPDMDASVPGSATMGLWLNIATALWSYDRLAHAGPVFGEGLKHWYYSGLLDGVEARQGAGGTAMNLGETLP